RRPGRPDAGLGGGRPAPGDHHLHRCARAHRAAHLRAGRHRAGRARHRRPGPGGRRRAHRAGVGGHLPHRLTAARPRTPPDPVPTGVRRAVPADRRPRSAALGRSGAQKPGAWARRFTSVACAPASARTGVPGRLSSYRYSQSSASSSLYPASRSSVITPGRCLSTVRLATSSAGTRGTPSRRTARSAPSRTICCTFDTVTPSRSATSGRVSQVVGPVWEVVSLTLSPCHARTGATRTAVDTRPRVADGGTPARRLPPDMDTQVADPLQGALVNGRYRVRARLARWSPAVVYAATDEPLGPAVMLHVPAPPTGDRPTDAAARLGHPNVVAAHDEGEHDGMRYLVTEHVRARTLRELLGLRQRLTPVEAVAVLEQILAGLAAAHRAGITHGDLTPERIFVIESPSGGTADLVDSVVKIGDFSLLRPEAPGGARGGTATAAYVAPELVTEGRSDARSDVYSAGIVLFEMLTGQVPHRAATPAEVAWRHVEHDVPPPSRHAPGVPRVLDDLVARATRRDPSARPTDAGALLAEVRAVRDRVAVAATDGDADRTMVLRPVA